MDQIEAMMAELSKRHGKEAMRAIATLMQDMGSGAVISFSDGTFVPCDFLMQIAWANGGEPIATNSANAPPGWYD